MRSVETPEAPTRDSERPPVSIIVVNYNGAARLTACVESLVASTYAAREIIVVDNASTDDSRAVLEGLRSAHPEIKLIWSPQNLGYAGAVNLALGSAGGELIAVLNMDMTVKADWLEPLVALMTEDESVGAVNPLISLADAERVNAIGQDIHVTGLGFNRCLGRPIKSVGRTPFRVCGIQGGAFLVRRSLLERIGGMDATGFLYHEDVNLSWLLRLMGRELYCVPESVVYHDYFLTMYPGKLHLLERNRWAMLLSYLHWPTLLLLSPALIFTEFLLWGYCVLRGMQFMRAKLAAYRWTVRRWPQIKQRRRLARSVRVISDWALLKKLRWAYAVDQFVTLGRERGSSRRQPVGGLPEESINN